MQSSPFHIKSLDTYQTWRTKKLAAYPLALERMLIPIQDPENPTDAELTRLQATCQQHNFALYRFLQGDLRSKRHVHRLGQKVGLSRLDSNLCADEDSLTSLQVTSHAGQHDYIPYTNKPLSWHTDGYYNLPKAQIYGMVLHCAQPALEGGESWLMDHEIAYILLRDANPDYIHALMHPNAFTIPANVLNEEIIRPEQSGPVFSVTAAGHLHMRYSARQRNVIWRDDPMTREAAEFLLNLWQQDSPYKIRYTLQAGEGLLCNNVLHNRTAFKDSDDPTQTRLLYRGRYFDRVEEPKETLCSV
ncbi:Taurine catabolism dioxygenase TauD, TfdA family [Thiothrix caldifontis]|uniref:Taurine catabolism dioxygenase TauD, TfdA family n=1 Tax=Thiothrix caldifontis TaxID=525918 RepID=A0A1H4EUS5_9GAMM|nr:TauD/TfdA family dioxygenase [Thiothrix caldifontis]SEA88751.1 Taurine catabolism dioxygenase TauD, TfdA family [Thiothrix caldifontis]